MGVMARIARPGDYGPMHILIAPPAWAAQLTMYLTMLGAAAVPETTRKLRSYQLRRFAVETGLAPFEATTDQLTAWIAHGDWSPSTRRSWRTTLRSWFRWAYQTGRVAADPAATLPKIATAIGQPRPAPDAALAAGRLAADQRVGLMLELAAHAGLRCCEICRVHSDDVVDDLLGASLRVHGKGGKLRIVPIGDQLAERIRAADGWLFPGRDHGHLSAAYASKRISRVLPDGWTAHTLRHRFASRAYLASGHDLRAVQQLLGHASVATTQIYTAVPDEQLRRAALAA
jgi:site-specific recombinase XerD